MKTMKTKLLAMLMAVTMVFAMAPLTAGVAFADDEGTDPAGTEVTQDVTETDVTETDVTEPSKVEEDSVEPEVTEESAVTKAALPETVTFAINGKEYKTTSAKGKGWTFKYKNGTGYLTLKKATISKSTIVVEEERAAIYGANMNLKITLKGKNKITCKDDLVVAVACDGNLTVTGKGSLNISGAIVGLASENNVTIKTAKVTISAISLDNAESAAIYGNKVTIDKSKTTVKGGYFGIETDEELILNKSTVTADGNDMGIIGPKATINNSKVIAIGHVKYGLYSFYNMDTTIKNSNVVAKGPIFGLFAPSGTVNLEKTAKGKFGTRLEAEATGENNSITAVFIREFNCDKFRITMPEGGTINENSSPLYIVDSDGVMAKHVVMVPKKANTLKIKAKTATVKYSKLKTEDQVLPITSVIKFVKQGKGDILYSKTSGNENITVGEVTGNVTVKTGLKKGTYKVKIKVSAYGDSTYLPKSKTVTVKIKVK